MLKINEINKIREMYYEKNMSVKLIARKLDCSPNTIYKYINFVDMNVDVDKNKNFQNKILPYKSTIISYYQEDKIHHPKQRHSYKRIYDRLKEDFPEFNCSYAMTRKFCAEVKTAVYAYNDGFLFLDHKAGSAQVDFGDCTFYDNDQRIEGKYCVLTFPYSNASYCQLMRNKTAESIVEAIRHIFEYIHGVPHTIWFDNDTSLVSMRYGPNNKVIRTLCNIFKRFILHYDFHEVFMSPGKGNEKGTVENAIKNVRKNLLVPVPRFTDFEEYNKELLKRCSKYMEREHYVTKEQIVDIHYEDLQQLKKLPDIPFEPVSVEPHILDDYGRLTLDNFIFYYLSPEYACLGVQVKLTPTTIDIYTKEGELLMNAPRIHGKNGTRYINWAPYIRLLANKPAAIVNFPFLDLFDNEETTNKILDMQSRKLNKFLNAFADMIDDKGLDYAVENVHKLL